MTELLFLIICIILFYLIIAQLFLEGKANFHPIRGKGVEWLKEEVAVCDGADLFNCQKVSPLRVVSVYNRSSFPMLISYIVNAEDGLVYSVWRFTKASYILGDYYRTHKKQKATYLKF
jgi:hypothetical protein